MRPFRRKGVHSLLLLLILGFSSLAGTLVLVAPSIPHAAALPSVTTYTYNTFLGSVNLIVPVTAGDYIYAGIASTCGSFPTFANLLFNGSDPQQESIGSYFCGGSIGFSDAEVSIGYSIVNSTGHVHVTNLVGDSCDSYQPCPQTLKVWVVGGGAPPQGTSTMKLNGTDLITAQPYHYSSGAFLASMAMFVGGAGEAGFKTVNLFSGGVALVNSTDSVPEPTSYTYTGASSISIGVAIAPAPAPTVPVTITSSPTLANSVYVDGTLYSTPQTFNWAEGSNHNVTAVKLVNGYGFGYWNDTVNAGQGARSRNIAVNFTSSETFAAYFYSIRLSADSSLLNIGGTAHLTATINQPIPNATSATGLTAGASSFIGGLGGGSVGLGNGQDGSCYANGRDWAFYFDGFKSSLNGLTWSSLGNYPSNSLGGLDPVYADCEGTTVNLLLNNNTEAIYDKGTMNADGSVTFTVSSQVIVSDPSSLFLPVGITATASDVFASLTNSANTTLWVFRLHSGSWSEVLSQGNAGQGFGDGIGMAIDRMANNQVAVVYQNPTNFSKLAIRVWTGSSFTPEVDRNATNNISNIAISSIGSTAMVVIQVGEGTSTGTFYRFPYTVAGGWQARTFIATLTCACDGVAVTTDNASTVVVFTADQINTTYDAISTNGGRGFTHFQILSDMEAISFFGPFWPATPTHFSTLIPVVWTIPASSDHTLRFANMTRGVSMTPLFSIGIWDSTNSSIIHVCTTNGVTCTGTVTSHHANTQHFFAWLGKPTGPDSVINSSLLAITWINHTISVTEEPIPFSYVLACGTAGATPPQLFGVRNGTGITVNLSTTPTVENLDLGSTWTVTNPWFSDLQNFYATPSGGVVLNSNPVVISYSSCQPSCVGTDPFQEFIGGCWWGTWYYTYGNLLGNFAVGLMISASSVALYLKNENPMISLLVFLISGGVFSAILPAIFLPLGGIFLAFGIVGSAYQVTREK